jgi:hypothetical protein
MKHVAIGVRIHSGWGVLVAVSIDGDTLELVERAQVTLADGTMRGGRQPYHFAEKLEICEAQTYLEDYAAASERMALEAMGGIVQRLKGQGYRTMGCGLLTASGRLLPTLPAILASHALIHTAEGEFFRNAIRAACQRLGIPVRGYRQRDLDVRVTSFFGGDTGGIQEGIKSLGRAWGPPWTSDHKMAALAACLVLAETSRE